MRRSQDIAKDELTMETILNLTTAFEGIASMRISQIKNQVQAAQAFFDELWQIYNQLRVDSLFRFGRQETEAVVDKELFIAITAEGGFSGDIDEKLIRWMLEGYDAKKQDLIIIGHHGAIQLAQAGIGFKKYFKLPEKDTNLNVAPLVKLVRDYRNTTVYYQSYVSLMDQEVKRIELHKAVQEAGARVEGGEVISEENYIFEPSTFAVIAHLEQSMVDITLSQAILESKLAQYASRFKAMSMAKNRAQDNHDELRLLFNQTKRAVADERLKEIINGLKKVGATS